MSDFVVRLQSSVVAGRIVPERDCRERAGTLRAIFGLGYGSFYGRGSKTENRREGAKWRPGASKELSDLPRSSEGLHFVPLYRPYSDFLKSHFGTKVYKIALDAGFTCPNRDGTLAKGGCTFCAEGSRAEYVQPALPLRAQLEAGIQKYRAKFGAQKFIAYFQAYTNTYGPLALLRQVFREPLDHPDVVGLSIGTRPDCVPNDVLTLLKGLAQNRYLLLEMGIQSLDNEVLQWINRGHDIATFLDAVQRAHTKGLRVCVHVILGFPQESDQSVITMARTLSDLGIDGIKIHNLHVIQGTRLAQMHRDGVFSMITRDTYTRRVRLLLENIDPTIWIHRLTGEAPRRDMLAPDWAFDKGLLLKAIQDELENNKSFQGKGM